MTLKEYQKQINKNHLYYIANSGRGIGERLQPMIEILGETADIYISTVFPDLYPTVGFLNQMQQIETSFQGIHNFKFVPNYIYVESSNDPTIFISSLFDAVQHNIPLTGSVLIRGTQVSPQEQLQILNLGTESTFPLARTANNSSQSWSIRSIFRSTSPTILIDYRQSVPPTLEHVGIALPYSNNKGVIEVVYGGNGNIVFGGSTVESIQLIDPNKWYQLVLTFDGGDTSATPAAYSSFTVYLTDLESKITQTIVPSTTFSTWTGYSSAVQFNELTIEELIAMSETNFAITDIWSGELNPQDAQNLSDFSQVDPITYTPLGGATLFVGWAMGNVVGNTFPFVQDYVYYLNNGNIINPTTTYRFDMLNMTSANFTSDGPPT